MSLLVQDIISKYLKYQDNIESCSPETHRAYQLDLKQAFLQKNMNVFDFNLKIDKHSDLWDLARPALSGWGNLSLASRNRKIATLKSFFSWLFKEQLTTKNYAEQLICIAIYLIVVVDTIDRDVALVGSTAIYST